MAFDFLCDYNALFCHSTKKAFYCTLYCCIRSALNGTALTLASRSALAGASGLRILTAGVDAARTAGLPPQQAKLGLAGGPGLEASATGTPMLSPRFSRFCSSQQSFSMVCAGGAASVGYTIAGVWVTRTLETESGGSSWRGGCARVGGSNFGNFSLAPSSE